MKLNQKDKKLQIMFAVSTASQLPTGAQNASYGYVLIVSTHTWDLSTKEYTIDHTVEVSECSQKPQPNMFGNENCLQKKSSSQMSNIIECKGLGEENDDKRKKVTNDLPPEDENEYILQVIGSVEKTSLEKLNFKETKLHLDSGKKPKPKKNSENKAAFKNAEETATNANTYSGKWSSLITDSTEKVVNFNSNESCTQLYNSGKQKSCRKRQMTGNELVSCLSPINVKFSFNS